MEVYKFFLVKQYFRFRVTGMAKRFVFFRLLIVLFWKFDVLRAEFWLGARLGTNNNTGQSLCVIFCRDISGDDNDTL